MAGTEDAHPVGDPLDRGQLVGGEEDGGPALGELADQLVEDRAAGDGVESEGGVVEHQELGFVAESESQQGVTLLALREIPEGRAQRDAEAVQTAGHGCLVPPWVELRAEVSERSGGQMRRRIGFFRDDADPGEGARAIGPGVHAEQSGRAALRTLSAEQAADQGGLAGAVPAEQRVHRAALDGERDAVEHDAFAIAHRDVAQLERAGVGRCRSLTSAERDHPFSLRSSSRPRQRSCRISSASLRLAPTESASPA